MARRNSNCRDEHGRWDIGSGKLELHDTLEETLRKEIRQEYCTEVLEFEFLGMRDVHRTNEAGERTHWIGLDYKVLIDASKVRNGEPHKFDALGWYTFDNLPSPLHSVLPGFFEKYRSRLEKI